MFKSLLCIFLVFSILLSILPACAEDIKPLAGSTLTAFAGISITSGQVKATGYLTCIKSDDVSIVVYLQKKSGNSWITITQSKGTTAAEALASAVKGYTYRAKVSCSSSANNETNTYYSNELTY